MNGAEYTAARPSFVLPAAEGHPTRNAASERKERGYANEEEEAGMGWEWREGGRSETWGLDATLRKRRRRRRCQYNASGNEPIVSLY